MLYIRDYDNWWQFRYDSLRIMNELGRVRSKQGMIIGRMLSLGFDSQDEAVLSNISMELVRSSEIEGEKLNLEEVRSSLARRLGIAMAGMVSASRYVEGVVEMQLDATQNYNRPLSSDRLFGWHNVLFPTGISGLYRIEVGKYRSGEMQVVSGAMGKERIHYQAPSAERVPIEMERFISWVNSDEPIDAVLKAAIAHLWFVSIHPFDDGNGRIARALTDMLLARSENTGKRFYSISAEMKLLQKEYYEVLERTQHGDGDITEWILWFLHCFEQALNSAENTLSSVLRKAEFWERNRNISFNERQRKLINLQFDGFFGKLSTGKWAKIAKCSTDTALNDIRDLVEKRVLKKAEEGGRSTNYVLVENPECLFLQKYKTFHNKKTKENRLRPYKMKYITNTVFRLSK
ncbi:Fic family protein [Bacteroides pyogenes]|uniref:Fic family protein n=1 Tax=Bacteroides pyogenes TaxID=310300 RepID=UPI0003DC79D8|nr:Fic family protein [Bacteroides pyogenes]MBB3895413.1 Fic family protein [Bacteroides pyogenes]GAE22906.1 Fic family protein [Bacteroides pyogenes JCM 10003]SUV33022.1 cell division protein Fic [Bacteroides pyogenes]